MIDRSTQYAIVVRAPTVPLRPLEGADWVILEMTDRRDICALRFERVQKFLLNHPKSQVVVYSFLKEDIGRVRCIGNSGARDVPPLRDIRLTDKEIREAFWFKVEKTLGVKKATPTAAKSAGISRKAAIWLFAAVVATVTIPVVMVSAQAYSHFQQAGAARP